MLAALIHVLLLGFTSLASQSPAPRPVFDVVSVKPNPPEMAGPIPVFTSTRDGYFASNISLKLLITLNYHIRDFQLSGVSGWMETEKWEVQGKAAAPISTEVKDLMVQALLTCEGWPENQIV